MTKRKLKLEFITDDAKRKLAFKKRKMGVMKKMNEIRTLCGVEACAIILDPNEANSEIYPPTRVGVQSVINKFRGMSEMEQNKKMLDQPTFMNHRILKANEVLKRNNADNLKAETALFIIRCLGGDDDTMNTNHAAYNYNFGVSDLMRMIEDTIKNIKGKRERELLQLQHEMPSFVANEGGGGAAADDGVLNVMQQNNLDVGGVLQQSYGVFDPNNGGGGNDDGANGMMV